MELKLIKEKYNELVKKKLNIKDEQALEIFNTCKERLDKFMGLTPEEEVIRFERILKQFLIKKKSNKGKEFEGLFILTNNVSEYNKKKIENALFDFEDPIKKQSMLDSGEIKIINGNPVVIDIRKTWDSGSKNYNYGKPVKVQLKKTIGGIVKTGIDSNGKPIYKKMELNLSNNDVYANIILGKVCNFNAIQGKVAKEDGTLIFYLANGSSINYKDINVDMIQIAKKFFTFTDFSKLKELSMKPKNKYNTFFFEAELINDNSQSEKPSIMVAPKQDLNSFLTSEEDIVTTYVKLPDDLAKDFVCAVGSPIIIAGQCWNISGKEGEDDFFGITARGVFYTEKKIETKPVEIVNEEEDDF